jgi:FAD dependent oxidoreductase
LPVDQTGTYLILALNKTNIAIHSIQNETMRLLSLFLLLFVGRLTNKPDGRLTNKPDNRLFNESDGRLTNIPASPYMNVPAPTVLYTDVLIIGGGTGGTAAGIQCARMGVNTIIAEPGPWLGGMLSSAGVSASDGNHQLPSGLWNEFREAIYKVYGGAQKVATGWISNTHFEPHIADSIFKAMAAREKKLTVYYYLLPIEILKKKNQLTGAVFKNTNTGETITVYAKQIIEATELGDVLKLSQTPYSLGMESSAETGEDAGITENNTIIQDLTYVAILKDYGTNADKTIPRPANYDSMEFDGCCTDFYYNKSIQAPNVDAKKMLGYAKLPNKKYMINWPAQGNDIYLDIIEHTPEERKILLEKAKQQTLRFIYFIQTQLGFKHLGLANDEFATTDQLAYMPYYRESRRLKGLARLNMNHVATPFKYNFYRTGISVGDYPVDHHHRKNPQTPKQLHFAPIPSFNIPLGALIPEKTKGLIVADKSISVSNIINGTTRLQPVVLLTGQAAGALAALCILQKKQAAQIPVRLVQDHLLQQQAMILPYVDAGIHHPHFAAIQKAGATGILKGKGIAKGWANQTWFYPDSLITYRDFTGNMESYINWNDKSDKYIDIHTAIEMAGNAAYKYRKQKGRQLIEINSVKESDVALGAKWTQMGLKNFVRFRFITRAELAVLFDKAVDLFHAVPVNINGELR